MTVEAGAASMMPDAGSDAGAPIGTGGATEPTLDAGSNGAADAGSGTVAEPEPEAGSGGSGGTGGTAGLAGGSGGVEPTGGTSMDPASGSAGREPAAGNGGTEPEPEPTRCDTPEIAGFAVVDCSSECAHTQIQQGSNGCEGSCGRAGCVGCEYSACYTWTDETHPCRLAGITIFDDATRLQCKNGLSRLVPRGWCARVTGWSESTAELSIRVSAGTVQASGCLVFSEQELQDQFTIRAELPAGGGWTTFETAQYQDGLCPLRCP